MTLTDEEWEAHLEDVSRALEDQLPTTILYRDYFGIWNEDRLVQQQELIADLLDTARRNIAKNGSAIVAGGMAGSGKTTVLQQAIGPSGAGYLTIDPDEIKKAMAVRRMIPEVAGLSPMEASPLVPFPWNSSRPARHTPARRRPVTMKSSARSETNLTRQ